LIGRDPGHRYLKTFKGAAHGPFDIIEGEIGYPPKRFVMSLNAPYRLSRKSIINAANRPMAITARAIVPIVLPVASPNITPDKRAIETEIMI
jgi:hypothetical protein